RVWAGRFGWNRNLAKAARFSLLCRLWPMTSPSNLDVRLALFPRGRHLRAIHPRLARTLQPHAKRRSPAAGRTRGASKSHAPGAAGVEHSRGRGQFDNRQPKILNRSDLVDELVGVHGLGHVTIGVPVVGFEHVGLVT